MSLVQLIEQSLDCVYLYDEGTASTTNLSSTHPLYVTTDPRKSDSLIQDSPENQSRQTSYALEPPVPPQAGTSQSSP